MAAAARIQSTLRSTLYLVQKKVPAVTLGGLVFRRGFSHGVVCRRPANSGVRFDAVPVDHQNHAAWLLDAGKKSDAVGTGIIGLRKNLTEDFNVFVALLRLDMLYDDFVNHCVRPSSIRSKASHPVLSVLVTRG